MTTITVSELAIYPIKSCRRVDIDHIVVSETGLAGDREWQIVTAEGACVTQRQHSMLATITPTLTDDGLVISADGHDAISVIKPNSLTGTALGLIGDTVRVGDAGDDVANWLSVVIGEAVRLVAITPESNRRVDLVDAQPVSFVDSGPVLVTSESSLGVLQDNASEPFGMDRFRSNIVVQGSEPWAEDTWDALTIAEASLAHLLAWPRCAVPQIDQDTGGRHKEPARVLKAMRWCDSAQDQPAALRTALEGNALFGVTFSIGEPGTVVRVGDSVEVDALREPVLVPPR